MSSTTSTHAAEAEAEQAVAARMAAMKLSTPGDNQAIISWCTSRHVAM